MAAAPKVLVVGDSISMGYTPYVVERLAGKAEVLHNAGNAGDSNHIVANLAEWLAEVPAEVIHFNCGLHDIKLDRRLRTHQVPLDTYQANLREILRQLRTTNAKLIWATTTPVVEPRHQASRDFDRLNRDVDGYNAAAGAIMDRAGIAINDLHGAIVSAGADELICDDGVHMTEQGSRMLGALVTDRVRQFL